MKTTASLLLAATAALTCNAASVIEYQPNLFQGINAYADTGVQIYEDHQGVLTPTSATLTYSAFTDTQQEQVNILTSLTSTFSATGFSADLVSNLAASPVGTSGASSGMLIFFKVSETTAYEASGLMSLLAGPNVDSRCSLREVGGGTLFSFDTTLDGTQTQFSKTGILAFDKSYVLEFVTGAEGDQTGSRSINFALTGAPIPEPGETGAIAALALAGLWVVRRRMRE